MKAAFVVQLREAPEDSEAEITGLVEEVDTGRSVRFRTGDELIRFLRTSHGDQPSEPAGQAFPEKQPD